MQTQSPDGSGSATSVVLDPIFHLPVPPIHAVFNLTFANRITFVIGILLLVFITWAVLRPNRRMIALAMILGGAGVTFNERNQQARHLALVPRADLD